jgi:2',3'-cyclic-nucleotide 2'-phosphodiesterase (5'-nucleotidase family)
LAVPEPPRFEPADTNFGSGCEGSDADACFGGFARQATAIKAAQAAAAAADRDSLVLFAGDQYSGAVLSTGSQHSITISFKSARLHGLCI